MKAQIIKTKGGESVILPRAEYDALVKRANSALDEDVGTARVIVKSKAALAAGYDIELPAEVAEAIARGENPLRVIREWRNMTQMELGEHKTNIGQGMISALESGARKGTAAVWKELALKLRVPMDLLVPE